MARFRKIADCLGGPIKAWHFLRGRGYEIESAPDGYTLRDADGCVVNVLRREDELWADGPVREKRGRGGARKRVAVVLTANQAEDFAAWLRAKGLTDETSTGAAVEHGIDALLCRDVVERD